MTPIERRERRDLHPSTEERKGRNCCCSCYNSGVADGNPFIVSASEVLVPTASQSFFHDTVKLVPVRVRRQTKGENQRVAVLSTRVLAVRFPVFVGHYLNTSILLINRSGSISTGTTIHIQVSVR
jgi:hypothetical protein